MNDMTPVIAPKSDQISADDLIAGPRTVRICGVDINPGGEQPVTISFDGDDGRPWKPCKSMSRVLVNAWGPDASKYVGRSVTLFRDPSVTWGGMAVGGIRISHMSDIEDTLQMALTATRGKRKPFIVKPLKVEPQTDALAEAIEKIIANVGKAPSIEKLDAYLAGKPSTAINDAKANRPDIYSRFDAAVSAKRMELSGDDDDPFGEQEGGANEEASDEAPPSDQPVYAAKMAALKADIDGCTTIKQLDALEADFDQHADALPDDVVKAMRQNFDAMRKALSKGGE